MPDVDVGILLNYAGITSYQVEDGGHWFTQRQIDLFHEIMKQQTRVPDIARDVGRNSALFKASGAMRTINTGIHHTFRRLFNAWEALPLLQSCCDDFDKKHLESNQIEIFVTPNPGVRGKTLPV